MIQFLVFLSFLGWAMTETTGRDKTSMGLEIKFVLKPLLESIHQKNQFQIVVYGESIHPKNRFLAKGLGSIFPLNQFCCVNL